MRETREDHLNWCKERALNYALAGDLENAGLSMLSDFKKHPDTEKTSQMAFMLWMATNKSSKEEVVKFIEGFN